MNYKQLPNTYKYDIIAEALYGRELEYFHYEFDAINFRKMLEGMHPGEYRDNLEKRLNDTIEQMAKVDVIYKAIESQIDDQKEYFLAVLRMTAKRGEK